MSNLCHMFCIILHNLDNTTESHCFKYYINTTCKNKYLTNNSEIVNLGKYGPRKLHSASDPKGTVIHEAWELSTPSAAPSPSDNLTKCVGMCTNNQYSCGVKLSGDGKYVSENLYPSCAMGCVLSEYLTQAGKIPLRSDWRTAQEQCKKSCFYIGNKASTDCKGKECCKPGSGTRGVGNCFPKDMADGVPMPTGINFSLGESCDHKTPPYPKVVMGDDCDEGCNFYYDGRWEPEKGKGVACYDLSSGLAPGGDCQVIWDKDICESSYDVSLNLCEMHSQTGDPSGKEFCRAAQRKLDKSPLKCDCVMPGADGCDTRVWGTNNACCGGDQCAKCQNNQCVLVGNAPNYCPKLPKVDVSCTNLKPATSGNCADQTGNCDQHYDDSGFICMDTGEGCTTSKQKCTGGIPPPPPPPSDQMCTNLIEEPACVGAGGIGIPCTGYYGKDTGMVCESCSGVSNPKCGPGLHCVDSTVKCNPAKPPEAVPCTDLSAVENSGECWGASTPCGAYYGAGDLICQATGEGGHEQCESSTTKCTANAPCLKEFANCYLLSGLPCCTGMDCSGTSGGVVKGQCEKPQPKCSLLKPQQNCSLPNNQEACNKSYDNTNYRTCKWQDPPPSGGWNCNSTDTYCTH